MSTEQPSATDGRVASGGTWHPNRSHPAPADTDAEPADSEIPSVEERVASVAAAHPERVARPVAESAGFKLREEALAERDEREHEDTTDRGETVTYYETVERPARPWVEVVREILTWNARYRDLSLKLGKGRQGTAEFESFTVPLDHSFGPEYQGRQYAELKALARETHGGERPTGGEVVGEFAEPVTALLTFTASTRRGDEFVPPAEHDRQIADVWSGSDGVRRSLRYVLRERLGLSPDEFVWRRQGEPHPGDGDAAGYGHYHVAVILDGEAADGEVTAGDFRTVVDRHVAECDLAGEAAHRNRPCSEHRGGDPWTAAVPGCSDCDTPVSVKTDADVNDVAGYLADYISLDPERDLAERSDEYVMWAATQWATATRKKTQSATARAAVDADACKQRYESDESHQERAHGEDVRRAAEGSPFDYVCAACGSAWEIDQDATLTAHRTGAADGPAVADGGEVTASADAQAELRERWPSARSAASRETRPAEHAPGVETVTAAVSRPPRWRPVAVVAPEGEHPAGGGGGVDYGEVVVDEPPPVEVAAVSDLARFKCAGCGLVWPSLEAFEEHRVGERYIAQAVNGGGTHAPLRPGASAHLTCSAERVAVGHPDGHTQERPLAVEELRERMAEARPSASGGAPEDEDGEDEEAGDDLAERVRRYVEAERGDVGGVVSVLGALGLSPERREEVEDVLAEVGDG